jgi:hypothetical protein
MRLAAVHRPPMTPDRIAPATLEHRARRLDLVVRELRRQARNHR